jgi:trehalose 6-phosphate phosphatase
MSAYAALPDFQQLLEAKKIQALIFDLDGVVTNTATVHARAWKKMFDSYLMVRGQRDGKTHAPFNIKTDYPRYIDGIPRSNGVRNFLRSRNLLLPEGTATDKPGNETINGLGNLKNTYFRQILNLQGVEVFEDTLAFIRQQKKAGRRVAIISASKNCSEVLNAAGIKDLFEIQVDGLVSEQLQIKGKPAPDIFLEAARRLHTQPKSAAIFEDARAGVKAGLAGGFGLVVGLARANSQETQALLENGADLVIPGF